MSSKFTKEVQKEIITTIAAGGKRDTAAKSAGVSPVLLSKWISQGLADEEGEYYEFVKALFKAEARDEDRLLSILHGGVVNAQGDLNPAPILFLLKARHGWGSEVLDRVVDYLYSKLATDHPELLAEILTDIKNGVVS